MPVIRQLKHIFLNLHVHIHLISSQLLLLLFKHIIQKDPRLVLRTLCVRAAAGFIAEQRFGSQVVRTDNITEHPAT